MRTIVGELELTAAVLSGGRFASQSLGLLLKVFAAFLVPDAAVIRG